MAKKSGNAGSPVSPAAPDAAEDADIADPGEMAEIKAEQLEKKEGKYGSTPLKPHKPPQSEEQKEKKPHWIEIELLDGEGKPVPSQPYEIKLPDGQTVASGTLDEKGQARVEGIDPGQCEVKFKKLDKTTWKQA